MTSAQHGAPGQGQVPADPWGDTVLAAVKAAALAAVALVLLPLVIPMLVIPVAGIWCGPATARFWLVPRWWAPAAVAGAVIVAAVLAWEAVQLVASSPAADGFFVGGIGRWWPVTWQASLPWLVLNLALGVLLVPVGWSWSRRRVARKVAARQIDDVVRQERIERARSTAEDWTVARQIGVRMDPVRGTFVRGRGGSPRLTGPHPVPGPGEGAQAVGLVTRPTVRTWQERHVDRRAVPDWVDASGRWLVLPGQASAVRAVLLAESGTGKTVLLTSLIRAAVAQGWPVVMLDAKGDPADAQELARVLGASGRTVAVGPGWNLFAGTAEQVTEKLMRLLPPGEGAARHYADEARGILGMVQAKVPVRSAGDLADRLRNPSPHVRDAHDLGQVEAVVDSRTGLTAGGRVAQSLAVALRPLAPYLDPGGWTYGGLGADVVVVPLSPVDTAQARLGDLMLLDLRHWMADRLKAGDKRPALLIVDEFPQLITADTDPGDVAAALFETARSAGLGLILAGQSPAGLSRDEVLRQRALSSWAGLILGRSKDPEAVVKLAGTVMRMEASGEAHSGELRSGRAQYTYLIPPQTVREAWDGRFWLIHHGAHTSFRVLPPAPVPTGQPGDHVESPAAAVPATRDNQPEHTPAAVPGTTASDTGQPESSEPTTPTSGRGFTPTPVGRVFGGTQQKNKHGPGREKQ